MNGLQQICTCPQMKAGEWLYLCAAHSAVNEVGIRDGLRGRLTIRQVRVLRGPSPYLSLRH
jgi:hypothetical protein